MKDNIIISRFVKHKNRQYINFNMESLNKRWPPPCKKNGFSNLEWEYQMAEIEINTRIFKKDNLDITFSISGKKLLNGILHYRLKSQNSEEIYLSEFAVNDRFITEAKYCEQSNKSVSTLFKKIIKNGYKIGKPNEK